MRNETIIAVNGKYVYPRGDGAAVVVSYTADENGYRPKVHFMLFLETYYTKSAAPPELLLSLLGG